MTSNVPISEYKGGGGGKKKDDEKRRGGGNKKKQAAILVRITRTTGLKLIKTKIHSPSRKTMLMIICTDPSLHFTFATNIERGERGNDVFKTIL